MNLELSHSYQCDGKTGRFREVMPQFPTIRRRLPPSIIPCLTATTETLFTQVSRVPYTTPRNVATLEQELQLMKTSEATDWMQDIFNTFMNVIFEAWQPGKLHLIGHSGGWDSRMISESIRRLAKKHGRDWLGDVLFVENHGEGEEFKQIMKLQGWKKDQYRVFNDGAANYQDYAVSFDNYYKKFDGLCCFPVNQWYDPFVEMGLDEKATQYFTGYSSNELDEIALKKYHSIAEYDRWHYDIQLSWFNYFGEVVFPFRDFEYIRKIFYYRDIFNHKERIPVIICNTLFDYKITPQNYQQLADRGFRSVSPERLIECQAFYDTSWYGRQVPCKAVNVLEYNEWWGNYCAASLIESMI